ncbi:hypothetical protein [Mesorhizobium delmotii]|uniref:hypothetical protein n=1 Tax=Mesorhizobium delmotii TaxID=1631247 RepID=UPI00105784DA|nr:hypothetical protein [Mesorhizobium delmotii]
MNVRHRDPMSPSLHGHFALSRFLGAEGHAASDCHPWIVPEPLPKNIAMQAPGRASALADAPRNKIR